MNKRQRKKEQQKIKNYLMYCACSYTEVRRIKQSYKMYFAEIRRFLQVTTDGGGGVSGDN